MSVVVPEIHSLLLTVRNRSWGEHHHHDVAAHLRFSVQPNKEQKFGGEVMKRIAHLPSLLFCSLGTSAAGRPQRNE